MDDFTRRFLTVAASQYYDTERILDEVHTYFDPEECPSGFLDYLASWLALDLDHNWPEHKQRQLILRAVELYRTRGLPEGIATFVEIYTGHRPKIIEHFADGMKIGVRSKIGVNTKLYRGARGEVFRFTVLLEVGSIATVDINEIRRIIEIQKPAWSKYWLVIRDEQFMQIEVRSTIGADTILGP